VVDRSNKPHQTLDDINDRQRNQHPDTGEDRFVLCDMGDASDTPYPYSQGQDRDNRGRVFLYCNPHDQVIGATPVQGMGWQGVSKAAGHGGLRFIQTPNLHWR
jgi:hypothetical protein